MWKDFGTKFNGILKSLGRHKTLVESRASLAQYRIYREDITDMQLKLDGLVAEEHDKKMKAVKEWLAVGSQPQQDHSRYCDIRKEFPSTGRWILKRESVKDWMTADNLRTPVFWLTGMPGAGEPSPTPDTLTSIVNLLQVKQSLLRTSSMSVCVEKTL
jgi:hypothetical protein